MRVERNDFERRARITLAAGALALVLSPFAGSWLVDHCPFHIRDPEAAAVVASWQKTSPSAAILVLGSSRLGSFVRTKELQAAIRKAVMNDSVEVFNATIPVGEPVTMEFLARHLLADDGASPRLVVLEMSPDLLTRNSMFFRFIIMRELTARDLPRFMSDIFLSSVDSSKLAASRLTPFFAHRTQLLDWATETLLKKQPSLNAAAISDVFQSVRDGKGKETIPVAERMERGAGRFRSRLRHFELSGGTSASFQATVAMLRARGCVVELVQPPVSSIQRAMFTADVRRQFSVFLQRLKESYGCEFVDFSERFPDDFFVDNHHANNAGSVAFTELLANEVITPEWRKLAFGPSRD